MRHPAVGDYADELARATREDAVVCGFSLGAIVAAHHADRLEAAHMVLFAPNVFADDPAKAPQRRALADDVRTSGASAALAGRLARLRGPDPEGARNLILRMAEATADLIDAQTALATNRPGALSNLSAARMPVSVVAGEEDGQVPFDLCRRAASAARGRLIAMPNLGHYALIEDPAGCAAAIIGSAKS